MNDIVNPMQRSTRREYREPSGKFKTAKLVPIMAQAFLPNESGLLEQSVNFELDPVAGRMRSDVYAEVTAIYIPFQAIRAAALPADENAGLTEVIRRLAMDGATLLPTPLENENEITKRCYVVPKSISGQKKVSTAVRLAYNIGVNYLRKRRYIYADEVAMTNATVTPAIINETILDKFNAALNPDEHINGNVKLRLSETNAPVTGIYQDQLGNHTHDNASGSFQTDVVKLHVGTSGHAINFLRHTNPAKLDLKVTAKLDNVEAEGFSLVDLYNAERADGLIRQMRQIAEENAWDGEDAVLRWVFGLRTDTGQAPFVLYTNRVSLLDLRRNATDAAGLQDEVSMTYLLNQFNFAIPVPATELGGIVVTYAQVTPDEVIREQPHPILTEPWMVRNHAAESLMLDPELIHLRELYADIALADDETDPVFYIGHNAMKKNYVQLGFTRQTDMETVDNKTVLWQYAIPAGVTPENILYPADFSQYPFLDQNAEVVTYSIRSMATVSTPLFFGPSPVEKLDIVTDEELLGEE